MVMASGSLCMTHKGHMQMLRQAKERLERGGYLVLAGWLVVTNLQAEEPTLSVPFRQRIAELCVGQDDFLSVCSWQADWKAEAAYRSNPMQALQSLSNTLHERYGDWLGRNGIRTFYVCGCAQAKIQGLSRGFGSSEIGIVICPRKNTEEMLLEKPTMFVLVADEPEEAADTLRDLDCSMLLSALMKRDLECVSQAMPPAAARLILDPTAEEYRDMQSDFGVLKIPKGGPVNPWPTEKLQMRIGRGLDAELPPAVIILSASMSPVHRGHLSLARQACERLDRAGYSVLAGWICPSYDSNTEGTCLATLSRAWRLRAAELAVCSDDFYACSNWEVTADSAPNTLEAITELRLRAGRHLPDKGDGSTMHVFMVCDPVEARKRGISGGIMNRFAGVVIVPRPDEECFILEKPSNQLYVADPPPADQAELFAVGRLRNALLFHDIPYVARVLPSAEARFMMHPTPTEFAELQADYELLGIKAAAAGAEASRDKLKDSLREWAGPAGTISVNKVVGLLRWLDPSWTRSELAMIPPLAKADVSCDELSDWILSNCS